VPQPGQLVGNWTFLLCKNKFISSSPLLVDPADDEEDGKEERVVLLPLPAMRRLNDGLLLEHEEEELETNLRPKFAAGGDGF
jgi:hypothetical protein